MRKTTKELAEEAGIDLRDGTLGSIDELETFRRLVIENERECAEAHAWIQITESGEEFIHFQIKAGQWGAKDVCYPVFRFPPADTDRDSVIEECARECECAGVNSDKWDCAAAIRAMKSQLAAPDLRDEALMLAKALLENLTTYDVRPSNIWKYFYASSTGDYVNLREVKEQAKPVLAAIDKVMKGEK